MEMNVGPFFQFARARHSIALRRAQGHSFPWTSDPILRDYSFTNVFREMDRTTAWFRENIRDRFKYQNDVIHATILFRWFNKIETAQHILETFGLAGFTRDGWNRHGLDQMLRDAGPPWVNGAYIIKTPNGKDKLAGVLWCVEQSISYTDELLNDIFRLGGPKNYGLEDAWKLLVDYPFMGPFMAYEVVTDLRHTGILQDARDINLWANPGPGARRGLSRIAGEDKDYFISTKSEELQNHMQEILFKSRLNSYWPKEKDGWPRWEMRDVEHTLCEFDKYERARQGEGRPKKRYKVPTT